MWRYRTHDIIISSPVIGSNGKVYAGSHDGFFYVFDFSGNILLHQPYISSNYMNTMQES